MNQNKASLLSIIALLRSILYQRGVYPPESFDAKKQYGLNLFLTNDDGLGKYLGTVLSQAKGKLVMACTLCATDTCAFGFLIQDMNPCCRMAGAWETPADGIGRYRSRHQRGSGALDL